MTAADAGRGFAFLLVVLAVSAVAGWPVVKLALWMLDRYKGPAVMVLFWAVSLVWLAAYAVGVAALIEASGLAGWVE